MTLNAIRMRKPVGERRDLRSDARDSVRASRKNAGDRVFLHAVRILRHCREGFNFHILSGTKGDLAIWQKHRSGFLHPFVAEPSW